MKISPNFTTNEKGELIPLNEEGKASLARMQRPRAEVLSDHGITAESLTESELGPGWVKVPRDPKNWRAARLTEQRQKESYLALGLSEAEADLAASIAAR